MTEKAGFDWKVEKLEPAQLEASLNARDREQWQVQYIFQELVGNVVFYRVIYRRRYYR